MSLWRVRRAAVGHEAKDMARRPALSDPWMMASGRSMRPCLRVAASTERFLPLMDLAGKSVEAIPFQTLPGQIDDTHRLGLDVGGDDA